MPPATRICAAVFVALGVAGGVLSAPLASAQPTPTVPQCGTSPGGSTEDSQMSECADPDNFQLDTGPPPVDQPNVQESIGG